MSLFSRLAAGVLLACLLLPTSASAQDVQVPFDSTAGLIVLTAEQAQHLDLFEDVSGFQQAELYRLEDGRFELVITYQLDDQQLRERRILAPEEAGALRADISARLASGALSGIVQDQDGRRKLLAATSMFGGYYGLMLPVVFDVEASAYPSASPLFGLAGGFFVPFLLTRDQNVTESQATFALTGGVRGAFTGALLALAVGGEDDSSSRVAALSISASVLDGGVGYVLAGERNLSAGLGEAMAFGSLFCTGFGMGAVPLIVDDDLNDDRVLAAFALAGTGFGALVAHRLHRAEPFTQGDARVAYVAGTLGFQAGVTVLELAGGGDISARAAAATLMGSTAAGLGAGYALVHGRSFARSDANVIFLGSRAGFFLGSGLALASGGDDAATVLTTLGTAVGFALTYFSYEDEARTSGDEGWQLQLLPSSHMLRMADSPQGLLRALPGFRLSRTL